MYIYINIHIFIYIYIYVYIYIYIYIYLYTCRSLYVVVSWCRGVVVSQDKSGDGSARMKHHHHPKAQRPKKPKQQNAENRPRAGRDKQAGHAKQRRARTRQAAAPSGNQSGPMAPPWGLSTPISNIQTIQNI